MTRIYVICEGQTEETFIKEVLAPEFLQRGLYLIPSTIGKPGKKGGNVSYNRLVTDLRNRLLKDTECYCTTLLDFYGTSQEFPGITEASPCVTIEEKQNQVHESLKALICRDLGEGPSRRFIPYIQMYEFEGLLFSESSILAAETGHPHLAKSFQEILDGFQSPEHINNNVNTAPSKRISGLCRGYDKIVHGTLVSLGIGVNTIRDQCALFDNWLSSLEELAAAP